MSTDVPAPLGAKKEDGFNVAVIPRGSSATDTDRPIFEEKPPNTVEVRVVDALLPWPTVTAEGEAAIANPGALML